MPVKVFSIGTTTDDVFSYDTSLSYDTTRTVPGDFFSYGTDSFSMPETVIVTSKTGKVTKAATDVDSESEDDASSDEASAKSGKTQIVAKVVRAMPIESYSGTAANAVVAENAAVINGAGAFFSMLTFAAVGMMMA